MTLNKQSKCKDIFITCSKKNTHLIVNGFLSIIKRIY